MVGGLTALPTTSISHAWPCPVQRRAPPGVATRWSSSAAPLSSSRSSSSAASTTTRQRQWRAQRHVLRVAQPLTEAEAAEAARVEASAEAVAAAAAAEIVQQLEAVAAEPEHPVAEVPPDALLEFEHELEEDLTSVAVTLTSVTGVIIFWRGVWSLLDYVLGDSIYGDIICIIGGLTIVLGIRLSGIKVSTSFWPPS